MTQSRIFDFHAPEDTELLNKHIGLVSRVGIHSGFEVFNGSAGFISLKAGVLLTADGVVIKEDANQIDFLPIPSNTSGNPRIDYIVLRHEYIKTIPAPAATYAIVQGTPSASPSPPLIPADAVILARGQLEDSADTYTDLIFWPTDEVYNATFDGQTWRVMYGDKAAILIRKSLTTGSFEVSIVPAETAASGEPITWVTKLTVTDAGIQEVLDHTTRVDNPHIVTAAQAETVTTSFDGQLSAADDTTQKALDTLDDHLHDDRYYTESEVDVLIDATLKPPEAYDPASSGNFPTTYGGEAVQKGDSFRIVTADTLGTGTLVGPEDLLIALVDTPGQTDANWLVVESNRDQATETVKGVAKIATQAIADAGINDTDFITALKAATRYLALTGGTMTGILNLVSASKVLELAIAEWGGRIIFEASTTGTGIPYDDFYVGQYADAFRIYQAGGAGTFEYDGQTGELAIPAAGDFKLGGAASLKAHPHTGASDGGQIDTAGIVDDAVNADKLRDDVSVDANRAVTTNHIRNLAVTEAKIAALAVTPAKLNVAGGENYHYESVKTLTYTIGPGDFTRKFSGTNIEIVGGYFMRNAYADTSIYNMFASVHLPDGATIISARMGYYASTSAAEVTAKVYPVTKLSGVLGSAFIDITSNVYGTYDIVSHNSISKQTVNDTEYYVIELGLKNNGSIYTSNFYFLEITYEMTNLLPVG